MGLGIGVHNDCLMPINAISRCVPTGGPKMNSLLLFLDFTMILIIYTSGSFEIIIINNLQIYYIMSVSRKFFRGAGRRLKLRLSCETWRKINYNIFRLFVCLFNNSRTKSLMTKYECLFLPKRRRDYILDSENKKKNMES